MSAPNLSAFVPRDTRFRVVYHVDVPVFAPWVRTGFPERVTDHWRARSDAVVLSPATNATEGGAVLLGLMTRYYVSLDIKTAYALGTVTWDRYLSPSRSVSLGTFSDEDAELESTDLLPAAGSAAGSAAATATGRESATAKPAAQSKASETGLADVLKTITGRAVLLAVVVLLIVGLYYFGPALKGVARRHT